MRTSLPETHERAAQAARNAQKLSTDAGIQVAQPVTRPFWRSQSR
jgi:hypothetical protein